MEFNVYNDNGVVRITKIAPGGVEQVIFSNLEPGRCAKIKVECYTSYSTGIESTPKKAKWCNQCHAKDDCSDKEAFLNSKEEYCISYS